MEPRTKNRHLWLLVIFIASLYLLVAYGAPTLEDTPLEPLLALASDAVLIDCVVKNLSNYTIIWRRAVPGSNKTEILSAGEVRIIPDSRFSLLHQPGHETWVLQIRPAQVNDSGRYICEVNTNPRMQIFRLLSVVERMPTVSNKSPLVDHNYTDCCVRNKVPSNCREFCSLQSVIMGGHPNPWQCMDHLPVITRCLTDGRNHMPCCVKQNIPEVCRSVCAGDYGLTTVVQHYSCMDFTLPTLTCIAEGIELLPGPPSEISLEALSDTELKVSWSPPHQNVVVDSYRINVTLVTELGFLDESDMTPSEKKKAFKNQDSKSSTSSSSSVKSFVVPIDGNKTSFTISELQPTTMYEVQMSSHNKHGNSMPTYSVRALTLSATRDWEKTLSPGNSSLHLPNITSCCERKGVPEGRCLTGLCDPSSNEDVKVTDILSCAPWVNVTFECMAGGVDHSQCCQQRGLPEICLDFCKGNISNVDYRHFACLEHIDIFGNCLLEFYGVLPGPPEAFLVTTVHSNWAVVRWKAPKFLPYTVEGYVLYWKEVLMDEIMEYNVIAEVKSPYLLDNLKPRTRYEVYVAARNEYGLSRGSARAVFTTAPTPDLIEPEEKRPSVYNETACCIAAGLKKGCLDLCTYNMKMSDLQILALPCADQLEILVRCGAGGRDHSPCCQRRGIRWDCIPICASVLEMSPHTAVSTCVADAGKIIQCMSEGVNQIPPAPEHLHATSVLPTRVFVKWDFQNTSPDPVWFEIRYTETKDAIPPHPLEYGDVMNVTEKEEAIKGLKSDIYYSIYVVAINKHGTSVPSLVLVVRTPKREAIYNETISAALGPPNSLEVTHQTMDTVSLAWRSPYNLPTDSALSYLVYYQPANLSEDLSHSTTKTATIINSVTLQNLTVNTQYAIAVKAITGAHESVLSETVLAWTDPAIPAFLNPPVVVPPLPVIEGTNVTLLCVATGMPVPLVSLLLNGQVMVQQQQSHVALVVPNIQHNASKVDCFADNGLGQGAQSSLKLEVYFQPSVVAMDKTVAVEEGSVATIRCIVSGHPEPRVLWYRDGKLRDPLTRGQDMDLSIKPNKDKAYTYLATLTIPEVTMVHEGQYFCHAENQFGKDTILTSLNVLPKLFSNASSCCEEKGVSEECMEACALDIDIETALNKPKCFKDLDKLMYCAADGSDHRKCCRDRGIQRSCLRWCQGRPIINTHLCILHASKIVSCFEEGKAVLPGPPMNIRSHQIATDTLEISWDMPQKNPKVVQWYKVFWRPVGSRTTYRNHTKVRTISLDHLDIGTTYEVVVKAGNHYGISLHSEPVTFTLKALDDNSIFGEQASYSGSPIAKTTAGVIGAALVLILGGAVALFFYQRSRRKPPPGISPGVSFENPTYMRDNNTATIQNSVNLNSTSETNNCDNKKNDNAQI